MQKTIKLGYKTKALPNKQMRNGIVLYLIGIFHFTFAQNFWNPSDSLSVSKQVMAITATYGASVTGLVALDQMWYADYPRRSFHFQNDGNHWLQMDKAGHFYAAYHLSRFGHNLMQWSGSNHKQSHWIGSGFGFLFLSAVEVMDGHSTQWGFSWSDMLANGLGTGLYVFQDLHWKEQRIIPKFSFQTTSFASQRPEVLGKTTLEQILKDYNGQTYWLSVSVKDFAKSSQWPAWLNVALGYGANQMLTATPTQDENNLHRYRQFYLSLDVNLQKIPTNNQFLKTFFSIFNTLKIPSPTLEINSFGKVKFHPLYF